MSACGSADYPRNGKTEELNVENGKGVTPHPMRRGSP